MQVHWQINNYKGYQISLSGQSSIEQNQVTSRYYFCLTAMITSQYASGLLFVALAHSYYYDYVGIFAMGVIHFINIELCNGCQPLSKPKPK